MMTKKDYVAIATALATAHRVVVETKMKAGATGVGACNPPMNQPRARALCVA